MAHPSLTFRGLTLQTGDQLVYTFSGVSIGDPSDLRAVAIFVEYSTLSGIGVSNSQLSGITINGGPTLTSPAWATTGNLVAGVSAFFAYVPTGTTMDVVVTFNTTMTRCAIGVYTLKPSSLTLVDSVAYLNGTTNTTDVTLTDVATVTDGAIMVCMIQRDNTSNSIIYTGPDPVTVDYAMSAVDAAYWTSFFSIEPSTTSTTNDIVFSSSATRRTYLAISMSAQGPITDTVSDSVALTQEPQASAVFDGVLADGWAIYYGVRYTPEQTISDTIADTLGLSEVTAVPFTSTLSDTITFSDALLRLISGDLTDYINLFESFAYGAGALAEDTIGTQDVASYHYVLGPVLADTIGTNDAPLPNTKYLAVVTERGGMRDALIIAIPQNVSDAVGLADAMLVSRAFRVIEGLRLADALLPSAQFKLTTNEGIRLSDNLRRFFGGDVVDAVVFSEALTRDPRLVRTAADTVGISDTLAQKLVLRVTAADSLNLTHAQALKLLFSPMLQDGVELAAAYISPGNAVTTWAINTKNFATTEYTNYNFNSFAQMGHKYLGATSDGLYELNGDDDNGTDIIAQIKSGLMQLGGSRFTSFKTAYLGMRGEGDFVLKIETGDGKVYNYAVIGKDMQTTRVHFGKGLRARYFSFELISTGQDFDLDTVEFIPLVVQRRV